MSGQSWFPSLLGSSNSSRPSTPTSSSSMSMQNRVSDGSQSPSFGMHSPSAAAAVIPRLRDKSIDELRKILTDKNAYEAFFNSLDHVKDQNNLRRELWEETLQLAKENLEKEPQISELRNQCRIIRTTELAAAQEKLKELERQRDEILRFYSTQSLLQNLQDEMNKEEEESEVLHNKLLEKEVDLATFLQKYKKLRNSYHRKALLQIAAKTSLV